MPRKPDAQLLAVLGARGCGKSTVTKQTLEQWSPTRLAVWDTKREHGLQSFTNLGAFIRAMHAPAWRIAFHPTMGDPKRLAVEFDLFCRALYVARRCTGLVEELAFVTRPNSAPPAWRTLLLLGRDENPEGGNVSLIATAQRPASVDKDLLGNCTTIRTGRLPFEDDARLVGRSLGVPFAELMALEPLEFIEKTDRDRAPRRFTVKFSASSPKPAKRASARAPKARNLRQSE